MIVFVYFCRYIKVSKYQTEVPHYLTLATSSKVAIGVVGLSGVQVRIASTIHTYN